MKKLFYLLLAILLTINLNAQTKVYTKGGVFYMIDTQTLKQYEGLASDVLVVRSTTASDDFYFRNVNGWLDAQFLNIADIQNELGVTYSVANFIQFYENLSSEIQFDNKDYYLRINNEEIPGELIVNKFGRNPIVGITLTPISIGGNYRTPTVAKSLEIVSTSALDTIGGVGAQIVIIEGLDGNFDIQLDTVTLKGLTTVDLSKQFIRVYKMWVSQSGTYATQISGSHVGNIILQEDLAGDEWARIFVDGFGMGQSQIGAYTIPRGYEGHLLSKTITVEANKPASLYFYKRESANDVVTPFDGVMRLFEETDGIDQPFSIITKAPIQTFPEMTDIGFFGKVPSGTASISVDFQLHLRKL